MTRERAEENRLSNKTLVSEIWCQVRSVKDLIVEST